VTLNSKFKVHNKSVSFVANTNFQ